MRPIPRRVMIAAAGVAVGLGAGGQVSAAPSATTATPGWRLVKMFSQCGNGQVSSVTAKGPRGAWASGYSVACGGTDGTSGPLVAHWNGRSWRELRLPRRFAASNQNGASAVAALSASYAWTFATIANATSYALLWKNNRWHAFTLARNSYLPSAVVFSQTSAWAFGRAGVAAYAVRFNGTTLRRVPVPVVAQATADPGPNDIWAVGQLATTVHKPFPQPFALAHWTGKWRTIRFPDLHLPDGAGVQFAWIVPDNSRGAYVTAQTSSGPGWVMLHWTGSRWKQVKIPFPTTSLGPLAHDGHGGLWVTSTPTGLNCSNGCNDIDMLHRTAAGTWTRTVVQVQNLNVTSMRVIPGTTSLWAGGYTFGGPNDDYFPVMLKYGR